MTTPTTTAATDHDLLVTALRANVLLSMTSGLTAVLGAAWLDGVLGLPWQLLVALGIGLLGFATAIRAVLADRSRRRRGALLIVAADLVWVVGALPLLALDVLTRTGDVVLAVVTLTVAAITAAQVQGLRRQ